MEKPSIDIFEAFDELLLMKRQVQVFYYGPLGQNSQKFIEYFRMTKISTLSAHGLVQILLMEAMVDLWEESRL
ncbi:hypothetical protein TorRG33x02_156220 [Trema orientale]|uniref:Uncharacterized protein n=1 Tax=Trema orientale TaxID=63057 RepID=A0A2P5ESP5_TREOI|nr:hypothetical protein TorRG33x02_156220 [Trema orientale]